MRGSWDRLHKYFPSNFTPELVMKVVNNYIKSLPYSSKNVVLFNYPSADMREGDGVYPRASDELYEIERNVGPAMVLMNVDET